MCRESSLRLIKLKALKALKTRAECSLFKRLVNKKALTVRAKKRAFKKKRDLS